MDPGAADDVEAVPSGRISSLRYYTDWSTAAAVAVMTAVAVPFSAFAVWFAPIVFPVALLVIVHYGGKRAGKRWERPSGAGWCGVASVGVGTVVVLAPAALYGATLLDEGCAMEPCLPVKPFLGFAWLLGLGLALVGLEYARRRALSWHEGP